jgi:subtilisin family serine protease
MDSRLSLSQSGIGDGNDKNGKILIIHQTPYRSFAKSAKMLFCKGLMNMNRKTTLFIPITLACALFVFFAGANSLFSQNPQSVREFPARGIIIKMKEGKIPDAGFLASHGLSRADRILEDFIFRDAEKEAKITKRGIDRLFTADFPGAASLENTLRSLRENPAVEYAEPDYIVEALLLPNDPRFPELWGLHNTGQTGGTPDADIDAPEAWDIATDGSGIALGVIDTGVDYTHPDLASEIWINPGEIADNGFDDDGNGFIDDIRGWDFVNNDNDPMDDHGHGTHVAGTIGAAGNNGIGVSGVNWYAKIAALKFLNKQGSGTTSDAIKAIQYAVMMGFKITNNSWGGGGYSQALYDAIKAANEAGDLFVAAAGNSSTNTDLSPSYPASYNLSNIISVAATDHKDQKGSFSNYGAVSVDLGAPGVNILSTVPVGFCSLCSTTGYLSLNGTSMATPHVAGAAALLWTQKPLLTHGEVKQKIMASGDSLPSLAGITASGRRLNLSNLLGSNASPPSNSPPLAEAGGPYIGERNKPIVFNGSGSSDPDGDVLTYQWDFGDGATSTPSASSTISHVYANAGAYTVTLTVSDGKFVSTDTASVTVNPTTFSDSFTRANSTTLGNGWSEIAGDLWIFNNELSSNRTAKGYQSAVQLQFSGKDGTASADFASADNSVRPRFGVILRYQDTQNYYLVYRQAGGSSFLRISRVVNGAETILKSSAISNPVKNSFFRLGGKAEGNTLSLTLGGIEKISVSDATFASGSVGVYLGSNGFKYQRADNFSASINN